MDSRNLSVTPSNVIESEPETGLFRRLVECSPSAVVLGDSHGVIRLVNARTEELFGYPRVELIGQLVEMLLPLHARTTHPEQRRQFYAQPSERSMGGGRDLFGRRRDGTEFPIEIGLTPIDSNAGILVLASIIDISERKRAQDQFRRIVESSPNAMLVIDRARVITLVNRKTEEVFGYERVELIGREIEFLLPERYQAAHPRLVGGYQADPRTRPMGAGRPLYGKRKDGTEVAVEIGLNPIEGAGGAATLACIIDISERMRIEDDLRRSNADLEQFAYVASHDLQEPLRMVANYTELLAQRYKGQLDEKADKYIHYAADGACRMQRLVADLLAYSRVGTQGKPKTMVSISVALHMVLHSLQGLLQECGATVSAEELPTLPVDEGQLRQLFQNLISNAVKFRSEAPLQVTVMAQQIDERYWQFAVNDNGIGLDTQYADRIFQMFQRLHEMGRYEGSGIGLAISKRIVERHGGRIWVESTPGAGSTFFFTLQT